VLGWCRDGFYVWRKVAYCSEVRKEESVMGCFELIRTVEVGRSAEGIDSMERWFRR